MFAFLLPLIIVVLIVVLYFVYDAERYHGSASGAPQSASSHNGLRPTEEVFRDPGSGQRMRVYEHPETGHREYRPEA